MSNRHKEDKVKEAIQIDHKCKMKKKLNPKYYRTIDNYYQETQPTLKIILRIQPPKTLQLNLLNVNLLEPLFKSYH